MEEERKRPGVGIPLVFPGVGIADCRTFAGVVDMGRAMPTVRRDNSHLSWPM